VGRWSIGDNDDNDDNDDDDDDDAVGVGCLKDEAELGVGEASGCNRNIRSREPQILPMG
jgi:hypothetical protein